MNMLTENMDTAIAIMEDYKGRNPQQRFRIETRVNKHDLKLYVISKNYICEIITIEDGHVVKLEKKTRVTKEEKNGQHKN